MKMLRKIPLPINLLILLAVSLAINYAINTQKRTAPNERSLNTVTTPVTANNPASPLLAPKTCWLVKSSVTEFPPRQTNYLVIIQQAVLDQNRRKWQWQLVGTNYFLEVQQSLETGCIYEVMFFNGPNGTNVTFEFKDKTPLADMLAPRGLNLPEPPKVKKRGVEL